MEEHCSDSAATGTGRRLVIPFGFVKAGIIAAGLGERFRKAGVLTPKPLLRVRGKALFDRAVEAALEAGVREIAAIVNEEYPEVAVHVRSHVWPVPVHLTVKTTPSSMESLFALAPRLGDGPFLLLLMMGYTPRVRLNPPLTISPEEMDQGLGVLDEVFGEIARENRYR